MARKYNDDDWDDLEDLEEQKPGVLSTTRILVGLLVVVILAIAVARLVLWQEPEFSEVTPRLYGLWTTSHPDFNDQYFEFRKDTVIIGTGGTGVVKYEVDGMDTHEVGDLDQYTIFYHDLAGKTHVLDMLVDEPGEVMRFTDSADAYWTRFSLQEGSQ
jgi:hypothetical protein